MNRRIKNRLKKMITCASISLIIFVLIMTGLMYDCQKEFNSWYSNPIDISEVHNLYVGTKDIKKLDELETVLQSKKIEYTIKDKQLITKSFNYDISNKEGVVIKENVYTENFSNIDNRNIDKVEYSVKYKDNQRIEKIISGNLSKVNDKYYMVNVMLNAIIITGAIYIVVAICIISCDIIYYKYKLERRYQKES